MTTIYLDESGNTGHNIIDLDQPIFTLAGCVFSSNEAEQLINLTESKSPLEAHFKNLKRRKSGQDGIIRLMSHPLIIRERVNVDLIHKNFMVTTKIVDILIEHMMYLHGEDLYLNGANIGLSNMLFYCLPTFCGYERVQLTYKLFVHMIRDQSEESIKNFYESVGILKENCIDEEFKSDLNMILFTENFVNDALEGIDKSSLDPSIPALFSQCVTWGKIHPKGFHLIHDNSKSIEKQELLFSQFMDWTQNCVELGYDRRKYKLPLKGKSLTFSKSESYAQLQVSDIIASSLAYWAAGVSRDEKSDYLFLELCKLNLDRLVSNNKIWPTTEVTPEELGTVHDGGLNPADHGAYFLMKAKSK